LRDRLTDAGPATGDNGGLHVPDTKLVPTPYAAVSVTKNLPCNYENLTLAAERHATQV
jgi:hypothetical protein